MKASQAGYSHREKSVLVDKVRSALKDTANRYWVNWTRDDQIELVNKGNRAITVRFDLDAVFPEADDNRPFAVAAGFRSVAVEAINAKVAEIKK